MSAFTIRSNATFEPATYRRTIAEMFTGLEPAEQRNLLERLGVLPRHIHAMAVGGLIAAPALAAPVGGIGPRGD